MLTSALLTESLINRVHLGFGICLVSSYFPADLIHTDMYLLNIIYVKFCKSSRLHCNIGCDSDNFGIWTNKSNFQLLYIDSMV